MKTLRLRIDLSIIGNFETEDDEAKAILAAEQAINDPAALYAINETPAIMRTHISSSDVVSRAELKVAA